MTTASVPLFVFLALIILDAVYRKGHRDGYRAAVATEPPAVPDENCLEVMDVFASGNVYWRYGPGRTELSGYCHKSVYPTEALETVAAHWHLQEEQRHQDAADALVDGFLATHGPFRLSE